MIIAFVGDGGFMMTGQELTTAAREGLHTIIIVCDNQAHGSILYAQRQQFHAGHDYATRLASPDFAALARVYRFDTFSLTDRAEIRPTLERWFAYLRSGDHVDRFFAFIFFCGR